MNGYTKEEIISIIINDVDIIERLVEVLPTIMKNKKVAKILSIYNKPMKLILKDKAIANIVIDENIFPDCNIKDILSKVKFNKKAVHSIISNDRVISSVKENKALIDMFNEYMLKVFDSNMLSYTKAILEDDEVFSAIISNKNILSLINNYSKY